MGLFSMKKVMETIEAALPVRTFEECPIPVTVSAFDVWSFRTRVFSSGELAPAVCASCCVPVMFKPVWVDGRPYYDGGILDMGGLAGVDTTERILYHHSSSLIPLTMTADHANSPSLVSLYIRGLDQVTPLTMDRGEKEYIKAYQATMEALNKPVKMKPSGVKYVTAGAKSQSQKLKSKL